MTVGLIINVAVSVFCVLMWFRGSIFARLPIRKWLNFPVGSHHNGDTLTLLVLQGDDNFWNIHSNPFAIINNFYWKLVYRLLSITYRLWFRLVWLCVIILINNALAYHFADDIFRCIFANEKFCVLIKISLKLLPQGAIDNKPAMI